MARKPRIQFSGALYHVGSLGSGFGNSVLTLATGFDKELLWLASLGFIFQGPCIMSSAEGIEGRGSFLMRETSRCSLPMSPSTRRDMDFSFMPTP
jgi:hypothetical protein